MRTRILFAIPLLWSAAVFADSPNPVCPVISQIQFCDVEDIAPPTGVAQLIYSPTYNILVLKNSVSAIATIDLGSLNTTIHFSNTNFTDMAISPSGRYVFGADYGGENIGYGTPYSTSYVHRLDLSTLLWDSAESAYIAGNVQAVADDQVVLKSIDQLITFTNDQWSGGSAMTVLNAPTPSFTPGYYAAVYEGDFRYLSSSARLLHGNSNESSQEIQAFRLSSDNFVKQEGSGTYGSAQGYGGAVALATDESAFYYGALQVDPLDVSHNLRVFPEVIYAATGQIAFGASSYYDAHTGQTLGSLGIDATAYGLNSVDSDFWAFDSSNNLLRHFVRSDPIFADGFGG
jgi:hypothetical protein